MESPRALLRPLLAAAALLGLLVSPAASSSSFIPVGARAIGMGGAFTATANDPSALLWNPAGLALLDRQELLASRGRLFGTGLTDSYLAFVLPLSGRCAIGADWYHSGLADAGLDFSENRFDLACAARFGSRFALGANLKLLTRQALVDGQSRLDGRGLGADFGAWLTPWTGWRVGLAVRNLPAPHLTSSENAGTEAALPTEIGLGISGRPLDRLLVSADVGREFHVGAEWEVAGGATLRAGLSGGGPDEAPLRFAAGAGFRFGGVRVDYAYQSHPDLDGSTHLSLGLGFQFNPARVRLERVEIPPLYASLSRAYQAGRPVEVVIRNLTNEPLPIRLSLAAPHALAEPYQEEMVLRPGVASVVHLPFPLSEELSRLATDRNLQFAVSATYRSARLARTETLTGRGRIYARGAINWQEGVGQAAALVTPRDPVVSDLARVAVSAVDSVFTRAYPTSAMAMTAAISEALARLDLRYVPDPENPYATVSGQRFAVDTVRYPRETLRLGSGDCDDLTVLLAALLESVGIRTLFADVPGHLFLLADTGLSARHQAALAADSLLSLRHAGRTWIPLEATSLGMGFESAWSGGAQSLNSWRGSAELSLVDVLAAQDRYPPAEPLDLVAPPPTDAAGIAACLPRAAAARRAGQQAYELGALGDAAAVDLLSDGQRNDWAQAFLFQHRWEEAGALLDALAPAHRAAALNNRGVLAAALGRMEEAGRLFAAAREIEPSDPGVWLNVGLARHLAGDAAGSDSCIAQGVAEAGGYEAACALLGLAPEEGFDRQGQLKLSLERARLALKAGFKRLLGPRAAVADTLETPERPLQSTSPADSLRGISDRVPSLNRRIGMAKADEGLSVEQAFYWKSPGPRPPR